MARYPCATQRNKQGSTRRSRRATECHRDSYALRAQRHCHSRWFSVALNLGDLRVEPCYRALTRNAGISPRCRGAGQHRSACYSPPKMPGWAEHGKRRFNMAEHIVSRVGTDAPHAGSVALGSRQKGPPVWLDMDQHELDDAYNQIKYAPNRDQIVARNRINSANVRSRI